MERDRLKRYLSEGLSLEQIGVLVNRDPATVGYWMKKHGLVPKGPGEARPSRWPHKGSAGAIGRNAG